MHARRCVTTVTRTIFLHHLFPLTPYLDSLLQAVLSWPSPAIRFFSLRSLDTQFFHFFLIESLVEQWFGRYWKPFKNGGRFWEKMVAKSWSAKFRSNVSRRILVLYVFFSTVENFILVSGSEIFWEHLSPTPQTYNELGMRTKNIWFLFF